MTAQTNDLFINRELSWLDFNRRVLDLSKDKGVPIGEQLKFAAIYASNLDEFFMVRVGSLYDRTLLKEPPIDNKTGRTPAQQLASTVSFTSGKKAFSSSALEMTQISVHSPTSWISSRGPS